MAATRRSKVARKNKKPPARQSPGKPAKGASKVQRRANKPSGRSNKSPARANKPALGPAGRWTEAQAWVWQKKHGWLVGANYTPRNAINQLEFWQADTFSPEVIDEELGWAQSLGYNAVRVFLHNLLWEEDAEGFYDRIDQFLTIATSHGISTMFVLFDSCWDPHPKLGNQRDPKPGVHNSGWVQGPGVDVLKHPEQFLKLKGYVQGVIQRFNGDARVNCWDLWNEPDNTNTHSYGSADLDKGSIILPFLIKTFAWARQVRPTQPLTSAPWFGDWSSDEMLSPTNYFLLRESDVISFHAYREADQSRKWLTQLRRFNRPLLCTEYMARTTGSTFADCLPMFKKEGVAAYQWGFVQGKTQTHLPWDSWQTPYEADPPLWFHEVFRNDGTPYQADEVKVIKRLTKRVKRFKER